MSVEPCVEDDSRSCRYILDGRYNSVAAGFEVVVGNHFPSLSLGGHWFYAESFARYRGERSIRALAACSESFPSAKRP